jgi:gliding motility-associated-like protein
MYLYISETRIFVPNLFMRNLIVFLLTLLPFSSFGQTSISGVINNYAQVLGVDFCNNTAVVESAIGFAEGDQVLLIQMSGAILDVSNTPTYGSITNYQFSGNYEILTIEDITFNVITFTEAMERYYDAFQGRVQLVSIPQYGDVDIDGELTADEWDGAKGGVVIFFSSGTVTLNEDIDVSGQGLLGGDDYSHLLCYGGVGNYDGYTCSEIEYCGSRKGESIGFKLDTDSLGRGAPANGGGGGNDSNTGGGGGSNFGTGGQGGERLNAGAGECDGSFPGLGGHPLVYSVADNKIFMGGGGGSGDQNENDGSSGADGGGIVIIRADEIVGNGWAIKANGRSVFEVAGRDAAGGGGGAGTVLLDVASYSTTLNVQTIGGDGGDVDNNLDGVSCNGPGGGGSGGTLWVSGASIPAAIVYTATGGQAGTTINPDAPAACNGSTNGATAGTPGGSLTGLVLAEPSVTFVPLTLDVTPDDATICEGESVDMSATADGTGTLTYFWNDPDNSTASDITVTPDNDFVYQMTLTDGRGCQLVQSVIVEVIDSVAAEAIPDSTIVLGEFVSLSSTNVFGPEYTYLWTPDYNIGSTTSSFTQANPFTTTEYCLEVTHLNSGCTSTSCVVIEVISDVVIPNAFSPNGDGLNDVFQVPDLGDVCNSIIQFIIYDRWGAMVHIWEGGTGLGTGPTWQGRHIETDAELPIGNYIYFIRLDCDGGERIFSGDVLLVR